MMTADRATPLPVFVRRYGIRADAQLTDPTEDEQREWRDANHWRVRLRRSFYNVTGQPGSPKRSTASLTVRFHTGPAISEEPSAEDVLNCLALDASGYDNARSFEEWASEYGYDIDSRKAEKLYRACEREATKLRAFLGEDLYRHLLWHTESL